MEPLLQLLVGNLFEAVAGIAVVGGANWARQARNEARTSHRILTGEQAVEGDDGLVGRVDEVEEMAENAVDEEQLDERVDDALEDAKVVAEREVADLRRDLPDDVLATDGGRDDDHA